MSQRLYKRQTQKSPRKRASLLIGWGAGIRTPECWYQKPVPYRLATPQLSLRPVNPSDLYFATKLTSRLDMAGVQGFEPRNAGIRNQCLTAWRHPNKFGGYYGNRTCDPSIMSAVL